MKISGCIIQNKNITAYLDDLFCAVYKGKKFNITTTHNFGKAKYDHLTRFLIQVVDLESGLSDVDTYEDCRNIREAIRYALKGACLIQK